MSENSSVSRSGRTVRRVLAALLAGAVLLVGAAVIVLPRLVDAERFRARIETAIEDATGWDATVGDVGFSVLRGLVVTVEPLGLAERDGESRVDVDLVEVNAALRPLLSGRLDVRSVELVEPSARFVKARADQPWPLPVPPPATEDEPEGGVEVVVERIDVRDGRATFEDLSGDAPLRFGVTGLSLTARPADGTIEGAFEIDGADGRVSWQGRSEPELALTARLENVATEVLHPFVGDALVHAGGRVSGTVEVRGSEAIDGTLRGDGLRLLAGERVLDGVEAAFRVVPAGGERGGWSAESIDVRAEGVRLAGAGTLTPDLRLVLELPDTELGSALETVRALFPVPLDLQPPGRTAATLRIERPAGGSLAWTADGTLAAGAVRLVETLPPAKDVRARFRVGKDGALVIDVTGGSLAGGPVKGTARLAPLYPPGRLVFDGTIGRAGLGPLLSGFVAQADRIDGPADVAARIETDLSTGVLDLSALRGRIDLDARDVTLPGWDLDAAIRARADEARARLGKLTGLAERIDPKLAESIAGKAGGAAADGGDAAGQAIRSVFETLAVSVSLDGAPWTLERLEAATRSIAATGKGTFDPRAGSVDLGLTVRVSPERTKELLARYPDLDLLVTKDGRLSLPMTLAGPMTKPGIRVDLGAVAAGKVGVDAPAGIREAAKQQLEEKVEERVKEKARGLLDRYLDKKRGAPKPAPADPSADGAAEGPAAPSGDAGAAPPESPGGARPETSGDASPASAEPPGGAA